MESGPHNHLKNRPWRGRPLQGPDYLMRAFLPWVPPTATLGRPLRGYGGSWEYVTVFTQQCTDTLFRKFGHGYRTDPNDDDAMVLQGRGLPCPQRAQQTAPLRSVRHLLAGTCRRPIRDRIYEIQYLVTGVVSLLTDGPSKSPFTKDGSGLSLSGPLCQLNEQHLESGH